MLGGELIGVSDCEARGMDSTTSDAPRRQYLSSVAAFYQPLQEKGTQSADATRRGACRTNEPARPEAGTTLGNTAKSNSASTAEAEDKARSKRLQRYEGLAVARYWLYRHMQRVDPDRNPGDVYRTHDCRFVRRQRHVEVKLSSGTNVAHYAGLATCGSVWACPLCAAVIQQRRRAELTRLITWAYDQGYSPCMVTFTAPHTAFDSLSGLRDAMQDSFRRLRCARPWVRFKEQFGFGGLVRSSEVTHGENGWHPHTHEIWLVKPMTEYEQGEFVDTIKERWKKVCIASGLLDPSDRRKGFHFGIHAVDVRFNVSDSDYLAKQDASRAWGVDHEIASQASKGAKGRHPHDFLMKREKGDSLRYLEYIHAMKGKSQLFWSKGLKVAVGIDELEDEDIARDETPVDEVSTVLAALSPEQWSLVRKTHSRAQLLTAAEIGGMDAVRALLQSLGWDPYA